MLHTESYTEPVLVRESLVHLGLFICPDKSILEVFGTPVKLNPAGITIMYSLMSKPGLYWTREELMTVLGTDSFDRSIDTEIKRIRNTVKATLNNQINPIVTRYKVGYRIWQRHDL